jgi:hypothetical protein
MNAEKEEPESTQSQLLLGLKAVVCEHCSKGPASLVCSDCFLCGFCREIVEPPEVYDLGRGFASPATSLSLI